MDPRAIKTYNKLFPSIIIDKNKGLSDEDLMYIFNTWFLLNTSNKIVIDSIKLCKRDYPSIYGYMKNHISKTILQPLSKQLNLSYLNNNVFSVEFWMIHGYSKIEANEQILKQRKLNQQKQALQLLKSTQNTYNQLGIDYKNKSKLDIKEIKKLILHIDKYFNPNSDIIIELANNISALRKFPSLSFVKSVIKKYVNPSGTPGNTLLNKNFFILRGWSETEANIQVTKHAREACVFSIDYYLKKGYSLKDAQKEVSKIQKENSMYSIEHWTKKGYTETEAKNIIKAEIEIIKSTKYKHTLDYWLARGYSLSSALSNANFYNTKLKEQNPTCKEYWLIRGYTLNESIKQAKSFNPSCIEHWLKRYNNIEQAVAAKNEFINLRKNYIQSTKNKQSKNAIEFLLKIKNEFIQYNIETITSEFFIKNNKSIFYYDYTDHTNNIIIEYNGYVWHSTPNAIKKDAIKYKCAENNGFTVIIINEQEYLQDKNKCVLSTIEKINNIIKEKAKNENHKR